jgi:translation initiation factor 2 alpha subunit (eIF-2alpha)
VIRVDPEQRQIGLSLKQVTSSRYMERDLAQAHEAAHGAAHEAAQGAAGMVDEEE